MSASNLSLAVIGGTGSEGSAIAARFAKAGIRVLIGSRDATKAQNTANTINGKFGINIVEGYTNRDAATKADVVLLSIPYSGMPPILEDLKTAVQGKIVINIASSLDPERKSRAKLNPKGSITAEVQEFFGEGTKVVAAFQNISPEQLEKFDSKIETDVLVCGGDKEAREAVITMIKKTGIEAIDAGVLANAVVVETLTAVLIYINIKNKVHGAGIRVVGIPRN
jgi:NADPH-dependent F420 reductase